MGSGPQRIRDISEDGPPPVDAIGVAQSCSSNLTAVVDDERWGDDAVLTAVLSDILAAFQTQSIRCFTDGASATVAFGNDAQVRLLNAQFRKIDKPTNVLSFPSGEGTVDEDGLSYLGDVVLAYETVQREAEDQGIDPVHHTKHLVVHGLLHLIGHDHMTEAEAVEMEGLEAIVLARLGIANPYED